jgi:two-component system sensor histidine kinase CpxA
VLRIFVRILISFWAATLVVVLISGLLASSPSFRPDIERTVPLGALQSCAKSAVDRYHGSGARVLPQKGPNCYEGRLVSPGVDATVDVSGGVLSHDEVAFVRWAQNQISPAIKMLPNSTVVALRPDSAPAYLYIADIPLTRHIIIMWHLNGIARMVLVSGLFSLLVTTYFVRPITRLSDVAENLGAGDLKARVAPPLSKRKDEVGDLGRVFNQMADRIESLVVRHKSFLAHASHELGSPLTRLNIALALARRKGGPSLEPEHDRIAQEANRLNNLVQELLLLARLESGNELSRGHDLFDLAALVEEACKDAMFEAEQSHKTVTLFSQGEFQVRGYPDLLRGALDNVLRNALRFAPRQGAVQVSCFPKPDSATAVILIQDDGPGVPLGHEESIFEPFVTLPNNSEEMPGGSGLGLAIARQAVIANGGRIFAYPFSGHGLMIAIELPAELIQESAAGMIAL